MVRSECNIYNRKLFDEYAMHTNTEYNYNDDDDDEGDGLKEKKIECTANV